METQKGREIFNNEKMSLQIINMVKGEETKNVVVGSYHCPNNNTRDRWDSIISYLKKVE